MELNNPAIEMSYRTFRGPWYGENKIVVGIDIGTTQSGVAFAYLVKGDEQRLYSVDRWPGQEEQDFSNKIPSVIWYDSDGKATSFGAEALTSESQERAEDHGWQLARHFKLHLHPSELRARDHIVTEDLPVGVPLNRIYSNFMAYLLCHTRNAFARRILGDREASIWETHRPNMEFVIAHPNGWGIREQAFLRSAAVGAGFTTAAKANNLIHFVTEAEASVHYCLHFTNLRSSLRIGTNFAICDAGGSTVDTTVYTTESIAPKLRVSERQLSACVQAGAIFVNQMAEQYLRHSFEMAELPLEAVDDFTTAGMAFFERITKRKFGTEGVAGQARIEVAGKSVRVKKQGFEIWRGAFKINNSTIQAFFDPYVNEILTSVSSQIWSTKVPFILLVGGFGDSPYLYHRLKAWFEHDGCQVVTPTQATSKAVADGAVIWYSITSVIKRAPRLAYGIEILVPFDGTNQEHYGRVIHELPSGTHVDGAWSQIVAKGIPIDCDAVSRQNYWFECPRPDPDLTNIRINIYGYPFGTLSDWLKTPSGNMIRGFRKVCTVTGNLNQARNALQVHTNTRGVHYWKLRFDVCIRFGGTELTAFLEWVEGGVKRTGPARIVPVPN